MDSFGNNGFSLVSCSFWGGGSVRPYYVFLFSWNSTFNIYIIRKMKIKIKIGQTWLDKETGAELNIVGRNGDAWLTVFKRSTKTHKMTEFILRKHYKIQDGNI